MNLTSLSLSLLGTWQTTLGGEPIAAFESDKVRALLAYLAVESDRPHRRETLAALFWPERPERNARQNLSQALFNLRQAIGDREANPSFLHITPQTIQFNQASGFWLDTAVFAHLCHTSETHLHPALDSCPECLARLQEAAALYQGDFLPGFSLADSTGFEEWLILKREQYHRQAVTIMAQLAAAHERQGDFAEALAYAWRQEALEPWHEEGHQSLMRLLARNGRRSQALTQYEKCRQLLWEEFGAEPSAETVTLYEAIRAGEWMVGQGSNMEEAAKTRRNQLILLDKVESFWIKGMLAQALASSRPIRVSRQRYDTAVARPWDNVIRPSPGESDIIPAGKTMGELFAAADQALLILGAPGSGKTVTLLQLARELMDQARLDAEFPIPVVLTLASWAESGQKTLADWVVGELVTRYQIPRRMGRAWLDHHELLLLLDGLDEVPAYRRDGCMKAIIDFRAEYGLAGIVICCRREAYEGCQTQLQMGGAILLRPLTPAQIDAYLAKAPAGLAPLRSRLQNDRAWQELAETPLMLNLMRLVYGEDGEATGAATAIVPDNPQTDHQHTLLSAYVEQMLSRRQAHSVFTPQELIQGLAWLAHQMNQHNQSIFQIEQMQPSWLTNRQQRWLYLLISRLTTSVFIGFVLWLTFLATRLLAPQLQAAVGQTLFIRSLNPATPLTIFLSFILLNLVLGLVVAMVDGWHFERRLDAADENRFDPGIGRRQVFISGSVVGILVTLYYVPMVQPLIAVGSGFLEAVLFTHGNYRQTGQSYGTEIAPVEALSWSWSGAAWGLLPATAVGLTIGGLGWWLFGRAFGSASGLCMALMLVIQSGLQHRAIETKSIPNQGIHLSVRNGLLVAVLMGASVGLLTGLIWGTNFGLLLGIIFTCGGGMLNGGQQAIRHGLIRLLLWRNGRVPLHLTSFLDTAADHALLYKVGGGYVFMHQLLQKQFADRC